MRRGDAHDSVETIIAAANAMAFSENRVQQGSIPRRRWKSWLGMYFCFGSHNHPNRFNQSVLVPEPTAEGSNAPTHVNSNQSSIHVTAPPPSPSSLLQSEPPSITQSPTKFFSLSALAANSYSPTESSVFTVGPYANDTRLVSPPVFSTYTTEPSTAPFTPPEPLQQMSPSSPEVPFARFLSFNNKGYDLYPGSPICHLISPRSVCSGTSSPFHDMEMYPSTGRIIAIPETTVKKNRIQHDDFVEDEDVAFEFTAQ